MYGQSVFQSGGQFEVDGLGDNGLFMDLGDNSAVEIEAELDNRIKEAKRNGVSTKCMVRLRQIVDEEKSIFTI